VESERLFSINGTHIKKQETELTQSSLKMTIQSLSTTRPMLLLITAVHSVKRYYVTVI